MERTDIFTIRLPRDLGDLIRDEAEKKGISASEEIRQRVIAGSAQTMMSLSIGGHKIPFSELINAQIIFEEPDTEKK